MKTSRGPLIVAFLFLILPVLYVGSYLALVQPGGVVVYSWPSGLPLSGGFRTDRHYRWGGTFADSLFWPLEQIDRKVRPGAWGSPF